MLPNDTARRRFCAAAMAAAVMTYAPGAAARPYPTKPVRLLAGQAPGGATDFLARVFAQRLNEAWSSPVVVENRPGASGAIAAELFKAKAGLMMTHVPFKGVGPSIVALVAGDIDLSFASAAATLPQVKAGRLRALAVSTPKRRSGRK